MNWFKPRRQQFRYRHEIHTHLLPGLDDGVKTAEQALTLIVRLQKLGIERISLTPHVTFPVYPNSRQRIEEAFASLLQKIDSRGLDLQTGAEYRITEKIMTLVKEGEILPFYNRYVLIEMSFLAPSVYFEPLIFELLNYGYIPVLAHPERYPFLYSRFLERCGYMKKKGCLLQGNLLSLTGFYGHEAEKALWQLLKAGLVDFIGSDLHSEMYADALEDFLFSSTVRKLNTFRFRNQ